MSLLRAAFLRVANTLIPWHIAMIATRLKNDEETSIEATVKLHKSEKYFVRLRRSIFIATQYASLHLCPNFLNSFIRFMQRRD